MRFLNSIIDFLLPAHCPICHKRIVDSYALCGECFAHFHFTSTQVCQICGQELPCGIGKICGACLKKKTEFHKNISVLKYDDTSKKIILPFKHADHIELAPLIAKWMILKGKELIKDCDLVIPVPLHKIRLLKRKYNQSALLAKIIANKFHKDYQPLSLIRKKNTPTQGHLTCKQRQENVKGVFKINQPEVIKGKKILLIDDVFTTGATLNECAKILNKSGAKQVDCLTFCRAGKN